MAAPAPAHCTATVDGTTLVTLTAGDLTATICPARGADLVSLVHCGRELLHRGTGGAPAGSAAQAALLAPPAQPGAWAGHGQTLFPAVGRTAGGAYAHPATGPATPLPMPLHGFAAGQPFAVLAYPQPGALEPALTCQLLGPEDLTPEQRASYPFRFALRITHALVGGRLVVTHAVTSREAPPRAREERRLLPFALGNHVSFAVPHFSAARLAGTPTLQYALTPGSMLSGATLPRNDFADAGGCALSAPGVLDGVFGGGPGAGGAREMRLRLAGGGASGGALEIAVSQRWAPPAGGSSSSCNWDSLAEHLLFVLWGQPPEGGAAAEAQGAAGFLCVEPWLGAPDALNGRCALLDAGETLTWEFEVAVQQLAPQ